MKTKTPNYGFKTFNELLKHLVMPEGFTMSTEKHPGTYDKRQVVLEITLKNPSFHNAEIRMECQLEKHNSSTWKKKKRISTSLGKWVELCGHTSYEYDENTYSFDAYGVSDSFYHGMDNEQSLNDKIAKQLERIKESVEYHTTALTIPQINRSISPERYTEAKKELAAGKSFSSTTAGFGVWYTINKRPLKYGKRAGEELEEFFGISPLYIQSQEMD